MGQLISVTIDKQDISITHQLPDIKVKKDRFIVKFIRRVKQDEFYKSREHLSEKKASVLPSVACEMGKSIHQDSAIYINDKFLGTNNGKIYLRKHDTSQTFTFTTLSS